MKTKKYLNIRSIDHLLKSQGHNIDFSALQLYKTTDNLLTDLSLYNEVKRLVKDITNFERLVYLCGYADLTSDYVEIQDKDFKLYKENPYEEDDYPEIK